MMFVSCLYDDHVHGPTIDPSLESSLDLTLLAPASRPIYTAILQLHATSKYMLMNLSTPSHPTPPHPTLEHLEQVL
jgi:hypothetical protein